MSTPHFLAFERLRDTPTPQDKLQRKIFWLPARPKRKTSEKDSPIRRSLLQGDEKVNSTQLFFSAIAVLLLLREVLCPHFFSFFLPGTRGFGVTVYEGFDPSDEKQIEIIKLERRMPVLTEDGK